MIKKSLNKGEPKTMGELLEQSGYRPHSLQRRDQVEGKVIEKTPRSLILDIGGKSEGLVAEKAYQEARDFIKGLEIGDRVTANVIIPETPDGFTILSLRNASQGYRWEELYSIYDKDKDLIVTVKGLNASGAIVDVKGFIGFIPISHLGKKITKKGSEIIGQSLKVKIIEVDKDSRRIVLSEKYVSEAEEVAEAREALKAVKIGDVYNGIVTTVADFGCFVEIDIPITEKKKVKLEGLVHISELAWDKVAKTSDVVKEKDKVMVKVLGKEKNRLALSIKQTEKDPWTKAAEKYKPETKIKGEIMKISDFGAFVQLEPGVEGLIHITKIPPGRKLQVGEKVEVYVEEVDDKEKRISLGLVLTQKPVGYK